MSTVVFNILATTVFWPKLNSWSLCVVKLKLQ